jgi:glutathione synthase/RimK-type ligase-like ATP-grasp enzyme
MRVGLVTCLRLPEPDPDHAPLAAELLRRGHEPVLIAWDGPDEDYGTHINVLRSTWNYYRHPRAFLAWVERASKGAPLINPASVVRWNVHKRYLAELQDRGVPIVPTRWFARGERIDIRSLVGERGWERVVIKPAISAASYRTQAFGRNELQEAQRFADELNTDWDILVQEFLPGYGDPGERSLVWIAGEWTHAVRKLPRFAGETERVDAAEAPQPTEMEVADAAIAHLRERLSYARVDLVRGKDGKPCVSELELMEPSLFFQHAAGTAGKFVDAIEIAAETL